MNDIISFLESNNRNIDEFFSIILEFPNFLSAHSTPNVNINDVVYEFINENEKVLAKFNLKKEDIADFLQFLLKKGIELSFNSNISENSSDEEILSAFLNIDKAPNDTFIKLYGVFDKNSKLYHSGDYTSCMKFIADNDDLGIENINVYLIENGKQTELIF